MKKSNHTAGPWSIEEMEHGRQQNIVGREGGLIATLTNWGTAYKINAASFLDELKANANLIAAAPDLLEACMAAEYITPKELRDQPWFIRMREAIARATGK